MSPGISRIAGVAAGLMMFCAGVVPRGYAQAAPAVRPTPAKARVSFRVPSGLELVDSAYRSSALRGRALLIATRDSLPRYVGNSLRCASCHLDNGLRPNAMPWVGSYSRFPQYRARSGRVDLIEDRVNDCFERSMNGKALPANGRDMHDIVAYLAFLSRGIPVGAEMEGQGLLKLQPLIGDTARGVALFVSTCARCHGANGQGSPLAPPLWGPHSYNVGAGMANVITAASFIHEVMPIDRAQRLSEQQSFDIARYINSRPRPLFKKKAQDYPQGGRPPGA
ncbi:MAG: c-type cytochrome [Gemmatimonadaceae bacterium]